MTNDREWWIPLEKPLELKGREVSKNRADERAREVMRRAKDQREAPFIDCFAESRERRERFAKVSMKREADRSRD